MIRSLILYMWQYYNIQIVQNYYKLGKKIGKKIGNTSVFVEKLRSKD